jgi:hypothetical protein
MTHYHLCQGILIWSLVTATVLLLLASVPRK